MSEHHTHENQSHHPDEDSFALKDVQILEYAYTTFKQYGYQNLVATFDELMKAQITGQNQSKLTFEIINMPEGESTDVKPFSISLESPEIKAKIVELQDFLKNPIDEELGRKEDWQMVIDIPYEISDDVLESALNTDAVFCYLAAQSWIENYTNEDKPFLFHRNTLKAGLRTDDQQKSKQLVMVFYNLDFPKHEEQETSKRVTKEVRLEDQEQARPSTKTLSKSNFMRPKDKTIKKTAKDMKVPSKYDGFREPPQEVPLDVIKKLFLSIDEDMDDRISVDELREYIRKTKLTIELEVADALFHECTDRRSVVHEKQRELPLTIDEVVAAIRGRHKWNTEEKQWEVTYRPMRPYWIILLKTISDKIFTIPVPQVKPKKILAQYELNEMMMDVRNRKKPEGTVKRYDKIEDVHEPNFKRIEDKPEKEYLLDFVQRDKGGPSFNPYEYQINRRIQVEQNDDGQQFPKMSWEARAFFEQSLQISKQDPTWESEEKNPIMYYIPSRHLPENVDLPKSAFEPKDTYPTNAFGHKGSDSFHFNEGGRMRNTDMRPTHRSKRSEKSMPSTPYEADERTIKSFSRNPTKSIERTNNEDENQSKGMIFGPNGGLRTFTKSQLALSEFKKTQLSTGSKRTNIAGLQNPEPNIKRHGFRTRFILNDLFTDKAMNARNARNRMSEENKEQFVPNEFTPFKDPVFRDLELPFGKKELDLLYKCPKAENPFNMSVMNTKPKMVQDKEVQERERLEAQRQEEYEKALKSDKPRPKDLNWVKYHHVPEKLKPMATGLKDEYKPRNSKRDYSTPFLKKDTYGDDTPLLILSRQMRENEVFGKPNMHMYFKPTKARDDDLDVEFGRVSKKYKTIY